MKSKLFSLVAFSIFAMVLFVSAVSALTFNPSSLNDFTYEGQSQTVTVIGTGSINFNQDPSSVFTISGTSPVFNITLNLGSLPSYISENEEIVSFNNGSVPPIDTKDLTLTYVKTFCENGEQNSSELQLNVDIENKGQGDDDKWLPLDTIEVKVELENNFDEDGDMDLNDVVFELGLYEKDSDKNIARDMLWISDDDEEYGYGDIDEGEDGSHTFEFKIDPDGMGDDEDYVLVVKAYPDGEESDVCISSSDDLGKSKFGDSEYFADIKIEKESDRDKMVVIDEETLPEPIEASCGQQVTFTADVWNIGDKDFEDQIMVTLYNKELGLDLKKVALGDLDAGEETEVSFTFGVPQNAEEEQYPLYMRTFYDYDEDDGKYEEDYDKRSDDTFVVSLRVSDCAVQPEVSVSATLESEAKAGKEMEIKITLENIGSDTRTFIVDVENYGAWAEISEAPETLTINSGSSKETYVKLSVNKDASGEKTFNILVYEGTELIKTQPVSVNIEPRSFLGITGLSIQGNEYLWGLGLLNIILVVVIIIVAVKVARRK